MRAKVSGDNVIEETALAIKALRLHTDVLQRLGEDITEQFDRLEAAMRTVRITDKSPELVKVADRLARLRELKNMMELGSFQIQMHNAIGEAWRRLP
jgi:hypothetical protein